MLPAAFRRFSAPQYVGEYVHQVPSQDSPSTSPAHATSGLRHWLATAVALAAVIGGALAVAPADGAVPVANGPLPTAAPSGQQPAAPSANPAPAPSRTATPVPAPTGAPHAVPGGSAPDPAKATLPLDCAGFPVKITQKFSADLRGNGVASTVVTATCDSPAGAPPDGVYVVQNGPGGVPRVVYTLVTPADDLTVVSVTLRSDGSLQAVADGYSSANVPRCCPDVHEELTWTPNGTGYTRTSNIPGTSV
jgi:hypothetical protein